MGSPEGRVDRQPAGLPQRRRRPEEAGGVLRLPPGDGKASHAVQRQGDDAAVAKLGKQGEPFGEQRHGPRVIAPIAGRVSQPNE